MKDQTPTVLDELTRLNREVTSKRHGLNILLRLKNVPSVEIEIATAALEQAEAERNGFETLVTKRHEQVQ